MSQRPRMKNRVLFSVVGLWLRLMIFHFGNTKLLNLRETSVTFLYCIIGKTKCTFLEKRNVYRLYIFSIKKD